MKHLENRDLELKRLREELALEAVPEAVNEKLRQLYAELPDQLPARQRSPHRALKRTGFATAGVAAALALLLGVNTAFPAFAEGLPFVGRFFQAVNGHDGFSDTLTVGKTVRGAHLGGYELQDVNVEQTSGDYGMTVTKAYSDGEYLTASLRLDVPAEVEEQAEYILPETVSAEINGQLGGKDSEKNGLIFVPAGDGGYNGAMTLALPQPAADGDALNVTLALSQLGGKRYDEKNYADNTLRLEGADFAVDFTVPVTTGVNRDFAVSAEDNGMSVQRVESTPISTKITVTEPFWGVNKGADIVLMTQDGQEIDFNLQASHAEGYDWNHGLAYDEGSGQWDGESFTGKACFDGVPAGTTALILRVYEDYEETEVLAEFTIDLAAQTAQVSRHYEEDGDLGLNSPFHYGFLLGYRGYVESQAENGLIITREEAEAALGGYDKSQAENGLFVTQLSYSKRENFYSVAVRETEGFRDLKAEIVTASGDVVAEGESVYRHTGASYRSGFTCKELDDYWKYDEGQYTFAIHDVTYQPAYGETLTVRLTDLATGEVLGSQDITMNEISN